MRFPPGIWISVSVTQILDKGNSFLAHTKDALLFLQEIRLGHNFGCSQRL